MIDEQTGRRKRPAYFWDEDLYRKHKGTHFLFRKPVLFCQSTKGVISPVFASETVDRNKYTGEKLRQLRAERGVGRPPHVRAAQRAKLLEGMSA